MKNIQKSIRMSQEIYEYIAAFDGINFNDKFEKCLLFCKEQNQILLRQKIRYQKEICELKEQAAELHSIVGSLENIRSYVEFACSHAENIDPK